MREYNYHYKFLRINLAFIFVPIKEKFYNRQQFPKNLRITANNSFHLLFFLSLSLSFFLMMSPRRVLGTRTRWLWKIAIVIATVTEMHNISVPTRTFLHLKVFISEKDIREYFVNTRNFIKKIPRLNEQTDKKVPTNHHCEDGKKLWKTGNTLLSVSPNVK